MDQPITESELLRRRDETDIEHLARLVALTGPEVRALPRKLQKLLREQIDQHVARYSADDAPKLDDVDDALVEGAMNYSFWLQALLSGRIPPPSAPA